MAHYAVLNKNNIVLKVLYINNSDILDENGNESDEIAQDILKNCAINGDEDDDPKFVKTSYNSNIRYNYASIGSFYDENRDAFIPPKPNDTFRLNEETLTWEPIDPDNYIPGNGRSSFL